MSKLEKVWSPEGVAEEHTRENARDLCAHAGWSRVSPKVAKAMEEEKEDEKKEPEAPKADDKKVDEKKADAKNKKQ